MPRLLLFEALSLYRRLIRGRVTHGYIRMANADSVRFARLMPVKTLLTVRR